MNWNENMSEVVWGGGGGVDGMRRMCYFQYTTYVLYKPSARFRDGWERSICMQCHFVAGKSVD